jgi:hypothetical protein
LIVERQASKTTHARIPTVDLAAVTAHEGAAFALGITPAAEQVRGEV